MNSIDNVVRTLTGAPPLVKIKTLKQSLIVTISDIKEMYRLRAKGLTYKEIAQEIGVSTTCVRKYIICGGVERALEALYE